jgi:hypothetical protein
MSPEIGQISSAEITGPHLQGHICRATFTKPIITGTSTKGPITAANAAAELMPNTAVATTIANSKLLGLQAARFAEAGYR